MQKAFLTFMAIKKKKDKVSSEDLKEEVLKDSKISKKQSCIACKKPAEYCMRGIPENCYCKECAQDYFKLLSYLEKLK
ncbi:MAG: hypothetical protein ABIB43_06440 [archaeon]